MPSCEFRSTVIAVLALLAPVCSHADMIEVGEVGAGGRVLFWVGAESGRAAGTSMRISMNVVPLVFPDGFPGGSALFGRPEMGAAEAELGVELATGEVQLTRLRASLLRTDLLAILPVELVSIYRDLDRGIEWGGDLVGIRVPVRVLEDGGIVVLPGLDLGVRHYGGDADVTAANASFSLEARAVTEIVSNWLEGGIVARIRGDLASDGMSGHEEGVLGFLTLALDSKDRLRARVFAGVDHSSHRGDVGLPPVSVDVGVGVNGDF